MSQSLVDMQCTEGGAYADWSAQVLYEILHLQSNGLAGPNCNV